MPRLRSLSPVKSLQHAWELIGVWQAPLTRYERHISAAAMAGGFVIDNYAFGRIDRPAANIIFCAYLALAVVTIATLHYLQSRADRAEAAAKEEANPSGTGPAGWQWGRRLHTLLPAAAQFALGGLLSGFLVFYSRSAVFAAAWPFLVLLAALLVGNEIFRRYRARLVFAGLIFFFLLYSYAIFVVPLLLGRIGSLTFAASGLIAIVLFILFLRLLRALGRKRFDESRTKLFGGSFAILALMNIFYFTDILPPLPLALSNVGIYHSVKRNVATYTAASEAQPATAFFDVSHPVLHMAPGESLSLFSAVFAPIDLKTRISHRWHWYDPKRGIWALQSVVSFGISGGREGGYRAYSVKRNPRAGAWRVDIRTIDGRLLGRVRFDVQSVAKPVVTTQKSIG